MAEETPELFTVLRSAYQTGLLGKLMTLLGQGVEEALAEGKLTPQDNLNRLDEIEEDRLVMAEMALATMGGVVPFALNESAMRSLLQLLENEALANVIVQKVKGAILDNPAVRSPVGAAGVCKTTSPGRP